tara:strand:+ start:37 stop:177 length:141 start_codon:yes stop_codon:yes gene_type:complete
VEGLMLTSDLKFNFKGRVFFDSLKLKKNSEKKTRLFVLHSDLPFEY